MPCLHCHCNIIKHTWQHTEEHHVNLKRIISANIRDNSASKMAYNGCFTCSVWNEHGTITIDHGLEAGVMFGHATKLWSIPTTMSPMHVRDPSSHLSSSINPFQMSAPLIILSCYCATLIHLYQSNIPTLVQIIACRLFGAKPSSEPMLPCSQLDLKEHNSMKLRLKFKSFHSRTCTWKCRLWNGGHFVSASMC